MKFIHFISLIFLLLTLNLSAADRLSVKVAMAIDTVPQPPGSPASLSGPVSACTGDTSLYTTEVPLACSCRWFLNDVLQTETSPEFEIVWAQGGLQEVAVAFLCSNGQQTDPESLEVSVYGVPTPSPIEGDEIVCEYTYHTYSTAVDPLDSCEWTVNGVVQPGYGPSIDYSFGEAGLYTFQVIAYNPCGSSAPQTLVVTAQGNAPPPPSPIQGPGLSCEGETATYTTTVGSGESCEWRVDGVLQGSDSTTLIVSWGLRGNHLLEVRAVGSCGTGNPAYKTVEVFYDPSVFLGNDTTIIQGQTIVLDAGNPGSSYLWSTGEMTQTISVSTSGTFRVDVSNNCGADSDTIEVSVYINIPEKPWVAGCFQVRSAPGKICITGLPDDSRLLQVFSITGQPVFSGIPSEEINIHNAGIYFIRLQLPDRVCLRKVIVL